MMLQQPEEVTTLHRGMLSGIADEQHPVVVLVGDPDYFGAFTQRVQAGFIDDYVTAVRWFLGSL